MQKSMLQDFEKWKALNKETRFSLFDYIFHIVEQNELHSDIYFAFLELVWPSFIVYKNYVLLKENFSEEKIEGLIQRNEKVEFWMNLLLTDPYFENSENPEKKAKFLAKSMKESWETKLKKDFPEKTFVVEYVHDEESNDHGITFYQAHS